MTPGRPKIPKKPSPSSASPAPAPANGDPLPAIPQEVESRAQGNTRVKKYRVVNPSLDPNDLTPGVLDGPAKRMFKIGACGALAIAIHDAKGWPIVAITDSWNVFEDGTAGGGSALHWTVKRPDGKLVDIDGAHDAEALVDEYSGEADEGEAAAGISTRADAEEWYIECQGEPVPVSLAAQFVDVVIRNAERPAPSPSDED